jgi:hypothetical protein
MNNKIEEVEKKSAELATQVAEIAITNQIEYETAAEFLKRIKGQQTEISETFDPIIKKAHETHQESLAQKNKYFVPLKNAEGKIKKLMVDYTTAQELKAKLEQKKLQDIADAEAKKQQKILDEKIARAQASGKTEKVEELIEKKENVVPITVPVIASQIETPKGISFKDNWKAIIIDANLIPREWCMPDEKALNIFAKSTKGTKQIPGVEFKCEKILNSRS